MNNTALNVELTEIKKYLIGNNVTEISINKPGELYVEDSGKIIRHEVPSLTYDKLYSLAMLIASSNGQSIDEHKPMLSGSLPDGERIQIILPPCVEPGIVCMSIRKPSSNIYTMDDYIKSGAFDNVDICDEKSFSEKDLELRELLKNNKLPEFIINAVRYKKNIIISGGTSTGKTTFANMLISHIPMNERLITIEDTRETNMKHNNKVHLLCSKGDQGTSNVNFEDLLEASLRLRPDRILLSELRGPETFSFLRAVNTGHPGSISTIHSDSPKAAFEQIILMVIQSGRGLNRDQILDYIYSIVDVVIQVKRMDGKRIISEIYFEPYQKIMEKC